MANNLQQTIKDAMHDCGTIEEALTEKKVVTPRLGDAFKSLPLAVQEVIETGGFEPFKTEVQLKASVPLLPKKAAYALDTHKVWLWDAGLWTDTGLSAIDQAKTYSDDQLQAVTNAISLKKADDPSIINIVNDSLGNSMVWIDRETGIFNAAGLKFGIYMPINQLKPYISNSVIAGAVDKNGNALWGVDKVTGKFFAAGLDMVNQQQSKKHKYFSQKPVVAEMNHLVGYGQSLKTGATATVILSTSQPYANVTFNTGPRKDSAATSLIPLVEQFNNPSSDGYVNRGETCCSGAANYASRAMMREDGINPSKHVIFASTAAHGGYRIDQLKKGSLWYSFFLEHITEAKRLSDSKTYKTQAVDWGQGENDAVTGGIQTPYGVYKPELAQLQIDATNDIKAITGQQDSVPFITYQMSYSAATWPDIAKAQLDLVRENDFFMLSTPMYHFPYAGDKVHLTNIGYKWFGAYVGRAYKQYLIEGRKSDFINPLSAQLAGNQIIIKFDVPTLPLRIDTTTLASTTNAGFKVMSGAGEIAITSVIASDDTVILQLASAPASNVQVRYALDYLGTGLTITGGASGNLRDSTTDSVEIAGQIKPLYHICPHFELTAFFDKGI
ncbi:sialate O-acetylesterase [Acinetobacter chinensis]|uniref:Sialate O-acetylesterase n=1 Tax=Acinetobacter chinensis TaxID=2004650 RepID=A0ABU3WEW3_9GAMM|nr:sialate O-acetylesterase [Acinetobacter chinensis]MDV2468913.1 sialate O-acetylesterase [Acinetobacter chinensis]